MPVGPVRKLSDADKMDFDELEGSRPQVSPPTEVFFRRTVMFNLFNSALSVLKLFAGFSNGHTEPRRFSHHHQSNRISKQLKKAVVGNSGAVILGSFGFKFLTVCVEQDVKYPASCVLDFEWTRVTGIILTFLPSTTNRRPAFERGSIGCTDISSTMRRFQPLRIPDRQIQAAKMRHAVEDLEEVVDAADVLCAETPSLRYTDSPVQDNEGGGVHGSHTAGRWRGASMTRSTGGLTSNSTAFFKRDRATGLLITASAAPGLSLALSVSARSTRFLDAPGVLHLIDAARASLAKGDGFPKSRRRAKKRVMTYLQSYLPGYSYPFENTSRCAGITLWRRSPHDLITPDSQKYCSDSINVLPSSQRTIQHRLDLHRSYERLARGGPGTLHARANRGEDIEEKMVVGA
ncbi:hypothetical protein BDZ89DRAFT_1199218 [Hymenopellis radicata]|nr:hypothetical protein BDZ89DRAFT_1199218 [Hymenopellis radicata]